MSRVLPDGRMGAEQLAGRRVLVLGLAVTGLATARALAGMGAKVLASDRGDVDRGDAASLTAAGVDVELGGHRRAGRFLDHADLVVPSPGISPDAPILADAIERGLSVLSEVELAGRLTSVPIVAVTGTNGKTTVSQMIGAILSGSGRDAVTCGNIGTPFLTAVLDHPRADAFVVEVSSFQLAFTYAFHPRVAVITNIAPDHLDWHGSFDAYRAAKGRIAARQTREDRFIFPGAQPDIAALAPTGGPRLLPFSLDRVRDGDGVWREGDAIGSRLDGVERRFGDLRGLAARGRPFVEDGLAAAAAALSLDVTPDAAGSALAGFTPDPHRLEPVVEVGGVRFVDDSKATNPHAAVAAVRGFDRVVLIAGGRNKGLDLAPLAAEAARLVGVVAIGEATPDVARAFAGSSVEVVDAEGMDAAVRAAYRMASPGDVVLLSPGCASFDAYRGYAHRGDVFQQACRTLAAEEDR